MSAAGLESYLDVEEREQRKIQKGTLKRLVRQILRHPGPLWGGMALILLGSAAMLMEPRLFGYAIDDAIVPRDWGRLMQITRIYFGVIVIRVIATIGQSYLFEVLGQRVTHELRTQLFSHLQRLPVSLFDRNPAGRLMTRVTNDVSSLAEMFTAGFVSIISNALTVLGILAWLLVLDLRLGLIAASVFPFLLALAVFFSLRLRVSYRESRSKLSALNAFLAENIFGMRVVHLFNRIDRHLERFGRLNQWYTDAQISTVKVFALFQPSITVAAGLSMALVLGFGGEMALEGSLKVGVLVAFFSYVLSLFQPVRELADKWNIFLSGMASAERIFSILDWDTELTERESAAAAQPYDLKGHIVFENVSFAYQGEHWVLQDFSLEILPGQRVGVVGHTGAGKTTLISLLMRFYEPQKGRILIDGRDIREYDKRRLRASIGIVQQDVFVFSGTMEDNVTFWGTTSSTKDELGALNFRETGELNERGSNLSMGERQVLAFRRAHAARPSVWILDEATANVDSGTEAKLQKALDDASRSRTAILIAHRLATVRHADQILVLHKGRVVEHGAHDVLMAREGLYSRLFRYQLTIA